MGINQLNKSKIRASIQSNRLGETKKRENSNLRKK